MRRGITRSVLVLVLAGTTGVCIPRAVSAQALHTGDTASVEVLGLKRWTVSMLGDSVRRRAAGASLASSASATILRDVLGFPDAAATEFYWQDDDGAMRGPVFVISVVEPQDSMRVRWTTIGNGPAPDASWPRIMAAVTDSAGSVDDIGLGTAVAAYGRARRLGIDSAFTEMVAADPAGAFRSAAVWRVLRQLGGPAHRSRALATLRTHPDAAQRIAALGVLQNFTASDPAWHALVRALRDPDPYVRGVAIQTLSALAYSEPRRVDWTLAAADLRLLLGGTNQPAFLRLLGVLEQTQVHPALAAELLAGNADLLLAHAGSEVHMVRRAATALLGRLSGRPDAGLEGWRRWAMELRAKRPQ